MLYPQDVLYSLPCSVTCMAVHPVCPYYIGLGLGNGTTAVMDRRMSRIHHQNGVVSTLNPEQLSRAAVSKSYQPSRDETKPFKITCIQFNETGSELLASYSEDYLYLFNSSLMGCGGDSSEVSRPLYLSQCMGVTGKRQRKMRKNRPRKQPSPPPLSDDPLVRAGIHNLFPPLKKLRLRGDWSDTGPESRPQNDDSVSGYGLMSRMSRMFTNWIDEHLPTPSESGEGRNERAADRTEADSPSRTSSDAESFHVFSDTHSSSSSPQHHLDTPNDTQPMESDIEPQPRPVAEEPEVSTYVSSNQQATNQTDGSPSRDPSDDDFLTSAMASCSTESPHRVQEPASAIPGTDEPTKPLAMDTEQVVPNYDPPKEPQDRENELTGSPTTPPSVGSGETSSLREAPAMDIGSDLFHLEGIVPVPLIQVVEGESDSDDEQYLEDIASVRARSVQEAEEEEEEKEEEEEEEKKWDWESRTREGAVGRAEWVYPFMVYKGHRNARTMVCTCTYTVYTYIACMYMYLVRDN